MMGQPRLAHGVVISMEITARDFLPLKMKLFNPPMNLKVRFFSVLIYVLFPQFGLSLHWGEYRLTLDSSKILKEILIWTFLESGGNSVRRMPHLDPTEMLASSALHQSSASDGLQESSARLRPHSTPATLCWLEKNYELSEGVCIPRNVVYFNYVDFCGRHGMQPVNAASFGKVLFFFWPLKQYLILICTIPDNPPIVSKPDNTSPGYPRTIEVPLLRFGY